MSPKTFQEQSFYNMLPTDLQEVADVSFEFQQKLHIIQDHLTTFYGERADWEKCLREYYSSLSKENHLDSCENIPLISTNQIHNMLNEEKAFQKQVTTLTSLVANIEKDDDPENMKLLIQAATLLGIWPDQNAPGIFNHFISRSEMTEQDKKSIIAKFYREKGRLKVLVRMMARLFLPGTLITYPHPYTKKEMTVMVQKPGKYFYRGENACYPSSKLSIYRTSLAIDPNHHKDFLILSEACQFLNQFDAVRNWHVNISTINQIALAQHYGIKTPIIDITSDLNTALFFLCCKYNDGHWAPLSKSDYYNKAARSGVCDARYGLLYRFPTELYIMQWALAKKPQYYNLITPIGYQPFMRCSAQHGYMFIVENDQYDMRTDALFEKYRVKFDRNFCHSIFRSMDSGKKIYPINDFPKIENFLHKINQTSKISKTTLMHYINNHPQYSKEEVMQVLAQSNISISDTDITYISSEQLEKINKQYGFLKARSKLDIPPVLDPMINI